MMSFLSKDELKEIRELAKVNEEDAAELMRLLEWQNYFFALENPI